MPSPRSGYSNNRAGAGALLRRWLSTHRLTPPSISPNAFLSLSLSLSLPIFTVLLSAYLICRLSSRSLCQISSMRLKKGVTKGKGKTSEPEGMEKNRPSKREAERNESETERVVKQRKIKKDLVDASASHPLSETVKDSKKLEDVLIKSKKEVKVVVKRERYKVVCKPAKLWDLISILNEAQKKSIKNVGFGGLLSFSEWNYVSWSNVFWFIENFNPYSRVLTFENGRNIVLTAANIEDLFLLPRGTGEGSSVLYYERKEVVGSEEIQNYKERLGLGNTPTLKSVFDLLANSSDTRFNTGGDDFVVLFILYAMCTFLAPTANTTVELSLLRTLLDVRNIGNRDWCSFVVKKLCKALESFKEKNYRVINGCLPVLPLLYCHRFKWQGICKQYTLPLIQHWTSKKFNDRFKQEIEGDFVFGRGDWVEGVFPISEHKNEKVTADMDGNKENKDADEPKQCPRDEAFLTSSEFITYKLPEGEKTDMCISAISKNDLQKSFMILKRDFNVIVSNHMNRVEELKKSTPKIPEVECGPSVSPTPPSQTDSEFWKSDEVIKEVEEIIKNFRTVNKEKILNNDYPMFDLNEIPSCSQQSFQPLEEDRVEQCLDKENVQPGNENLNEVDTSLDGSDIVIGYSYRMQEEYGDLEEMIQPLPEMQMNVDANLTIFTRRKNRGIEDPCIPTFRLLSQSSVEESEEYAEVLAEKTQNQDNVETEKLAEIMMKLNQVDVDEEICQQKSTDIEMSEAVREHYKLHKTDEAMNVCSVEPMQCSSNIEWMTDKPTFKSRVINNNARYWKEMSRQEKDIADLCFHEHRPMNTSNVFTHNLYRWKFVMNFNGIRSLNDSCFIDTIVIDAWALMLNKKSKFYSLKKSTQPQNFYFNTHHSSYLECILRRDDPKVIKSKAFDVRSCWHFCLKQMIQLNDLKSFTFFFIPICFNSHFIGVVVNIDQKKIQYLDNILGNCEEGNEIWMFLQIVKQQFSIFLHDMEHPKAGMVESFPIEDVPLDWKSDKSNVDCGVYLMHHMEHFHGFPYINTELSQAPQRRKLRAMYCSRIILSDLNTCRDEILNEILTFAKRKK